MHLTRYLVALAFVAGPAFANLPHQGVLTGQYFSVSYEFLPYDEPPENMSIIDGSLAWFGGRAQEAETYPMAGAYQGSFYATLSFEAAPGYEIAGYEIGYAISFRTDHYVIRQGDVPYFGPPGTLIHSAGDFSASTGASYAFTGEQATAQATLVDSLDRLPQTFSGVISILSPRVECLREDPLSGLCVATSTVAGSASIDLITIRPLLLNTDVSRAAMGAFVSPAPEPSTWAMMAIGLCALLLRRQAAIAPRS